jgi:hypothetical protein
MSIRSLHRPSQILRPLSQSYCSLGNTWSDEVRTYFTRGSTVPFIARYQFCNLQEAG